MATEHEGSSLADGGAAPPQRSGSSAETHLERLAQTFETSARRWELIVYPSVVGFILLALYGFYLVYHVTRDMADLASSTRAMQQTVTLMAADVHGMSGDAKTMTSLVGHVAGRMDSMDTTMGGMGRTMQQMDESVQRVSLQMDGAVANMHLMNRQFDAMNFQVGRVGADMSGMHQAIGRPLGFMNAFMPW